jgi:hypothetical protein
LADSAAMRCFYHPDREAVGVCKSCHKGLCAESAIDVGDGIACPGPCEHFVERLNAALGKADEMASTWSPIMGSWMTALGAVMAAFGVFAWVAWGDAAFGVWLVLLGGIFAFPARTLVTARRRGS